MKFIAAFTLSAALLLTSSAYAEEPSVVSKEWHSYVEPMMPIGERMAALMPDQEDPRMRLDLYRMIFMGISTAFVGESLGDPQHPTFWPIWNPVFNWFAPNPDDSYSEAKIDGNGIYKISGFRGTVRLLDFQIGNLALYDGGEFGKNPTLADYFADTLHVKKDGSFEVILSNERPAGYKGDWWKLDPKATSILVRQVSYDWVNEVDARFAIERLNQAGPKPLPSAEDIDAQLRKIPVWAENWTKLSLLWPKNLRDRGYVNKLWAHNLSDLGGVTTQTYVEGLIEMNPDEALIYETEVPKKCAYWNIEITDMLWSLVDVMNRQSSLNGHTAKLDKDGKFRAVISISDPGVPNWLDTGGHTKGTIFARWTGCSSNPTPVITRVKFSDLRKYLPADTPLVSAEARIAVLRLRSKGVQLRRRW